MIFRHFPIHKVEQILKMKMLLFHYVNNWIRNDKSRSRQWVHAWIHRIDRKIDGACHSWWKSIVIIYLIFSRQSFHHYIILFRSVPLIIVTHTGNDKQRNGTEQNVCTLKSDILIGFLYYDSFQQFKVIFSVYIWSEYIFPHCPLYPLFPPYSYRASLSIVQHLLKYKYGR